MLFAFAATFSSKLKALKEKKKKNLFRPFFECKVFLGKEVDYRERLFMVDRHV
jgi:hypothetical protein